MTVHYIDPVGKATTVPNRYDLKADLTKPCVVALVANRIVDCDLFMEHIGQALVAVRPSVTLRFYPTGNVTAAEPDLIAKVAAECDAAICAIGHCGSCTAGTVKDGIGVIAQGIPAVTLVTEVFWEQAAALATGLGWPDAPRVKLPYPVWGSDEASIKALAVEKIGEITAKLERSDD